MSTAKSLRAIAFIFTSIAAGAANAAEQPAAFDPGSCATPEYRERWIKDGVDGQVTLAFVVGADGRTTEMKVLESSGNSDIDRASARAAMSCSFKAAVRNGHAVPGLARVRYNWIVQ